MSTSSNLSKIIITSIPYLEVSAIGDSFGSVVEKYSLNDIASHLNLNAESLEAEYVRNGFKRTNDRIACECVKEICQDINPSWEGKAACEVDGLKELSPMTASCDQKPALSFSLMMLWDLWLKSILHQWYILLRRHVLEQQISFGYSKSKGLILDK